MRIEEMSWSEFWDSRTPEQQEELLIKYFPQSKGTVTDVAKLHIWRKERDAEKAPVEESPAEKQVVITLSMAQNMMYMTVKNDDGVPQEMILGSLEILKQRIISTLQ